jgi:pimeloyl-ACP methyl ester carboxylesterase
MDERAFIAQLESAGPERFAEMLVRPSAAEEQALRAYLGDERYQRLHSMALRRSVSRAAPDKRPNVVVIHGIMGAELAALDASGAQDPIWLKLLRIVTGRFERLRLGEDGRTSPYDVRATGILKRHYGELLLSLSQRWNVRAFWFDWRKDLNLAAAELQAQLSGWFGDDAPFDIVAHSMGGLVARTFIRNYPGRWETAARRLIMLGTPNHGSFAIPQVITGAEPIVRKLALLDPYHSRAALLDILNTFPGSFQMLPSPLRLPEMARLYEPRTWGELNVPERHLAAARRHHEELSGVVDPGRMIYIAGYNQPTFSGIADWERMDAAEGYLMTRDGDGRVTHELGKLEGVPIYYVEENHGDLPANKDVLDALDELLESGATRALASQLPARRGAEPDPAELRRQWLAAESEDEQRVRGMVTRMRSRGPEDAPDHTSAEERALEETLARGFLSYGLLEGRAERPMDVPFAPARIEIALQLGSIDEIACEDIRAESGSAVDAIAVGHYIGVKPQAAERALDLAISRALPGIAPGGDGALRESDLLLTQYSERGILKGDLGQPFFLADPRRPDRVLAIAGMGFPGRFGAPELAVLARELCWALGRMGKRHLATVLIGAGNGNLSGCDAICGWIRGIKEALSGSAEDECRRLERITFVERDPRKLAELDRSIREESRRLDAKHRLLIRYSPPKELEPAVLESLVRQADEAARRSASRRRAPREQAPTRVTLEFDGRSYRYGAITETASIPEREIQLDPRLVEEANDEIAAEARPELQLERGQFLEQLLLPRDLRERVGGSAPLVMMLDATAARIHWEMVAQSGLGDRAFLGISRGFTRQLRTTFAPPPEPPPPPRRVLRVLVVADPAEDARLPGAEAEGAEIADLFESFNRVWCNCANRVQVVRLFGPREATRTNVLRELTVRTYDVLHFAGHCTYDAAHPPASGWIFTGGARLTANELSRIDRVPKFVFSNACESGITPSRAEKRSAALAPSFAEAFFARGVSNFVCTAWPVDDAGAREFALALYGRLLGIDGAAARAPDVMHAAMREAREAIAEKPEGVRTWGAYQHYGSPYFRFFEASAMAL